MTSWCSDIVLKLEMWELMPGDIVITWLGNPHSTWMGILSYGPSDDLFYIDEEYYEMVSLPLSKRVRLVISEFDGSISSSEPTLGQSLPARQDFGNYKASNFFCKTLNYIHRLSTSPLSFFTTLQTLLTNLKLFLHSKKWSSSTASSFLPPFLRPLLFLWPTATWKSANVTMMLRRNVSWLVTLPALPPDQLEWAPVCRVAVSLPNLNQHLRVSWNWLF